MTKTEIIGLSNEALIAHVMNIEAQATKEANSRRGISKQTKKDYMWTVEEVAQRFSLDIRTIVSLTGSAHWWEQES